MDILTNCRSVKNQFRSIRFHRVVLVLIKRFCRLGRRRADTIIFISRTVNQSSSKSLLSW